jgi:hypothetical protein
MLYLEHALFVQPLLVLQQVSFGGSAFEDSAVVMY